MNIKRSTFILFKTNKTGKNLTYIVLIMTLNIVSRSYTLQVLVWGNSNTEHSKKNLKITLYCSLFIPIYTTVHVSGCETLP